MTCKFSAVLILVALSALPVSAQTVPNKPGASKAAAEDKPKADVKSQAEAAGKAVKLGTIAMSDPKLKAAVKATDLDAAKKAVGKPVGFTGTVTEIYSGKGNRMTALNFDPEYKKALTAVIFPATYPKLPDVKTLKGKKIFVSGKIEEFHGGYEVIVNGPDQIKIVK